MSPIWVCAEHGEALVQCDNQVYSFMGISIHVPAFTTNTIESKVKAVTGTKGPDIWGEGISGSWNISGRFREEVTRNMNPKEGAGVVGGW